MLTLIVFATIMALFYNYNHEKVTSYAIERTHGLLSNIATEISSQLMSVETTINQSTWVPIRALPCFVCLQSQYFFQHFTLVISVGSYIVMMYLLHS